MEVKGSEETRTDLAAWHALHCPEARLASFSLRLHAHTQLSLPSIWLTSTSADHSCKTGWLRHLRYYHYYQDVPDSAALLPIPTPESYPAQIEVYLGSRLVVHTASPSYERGLRSRGS